jgi:hypothetical protein
VAETSVPLFIDECVHFKLAAALRSVGWDAVHVAEVQRKRESDESQLAFATSEGRAVLTYNSRDYSPMHYRWQGQGKEHAGLILSPDYKQDVGSLFRDLRTTVKMHSESADGDGWMHNQMIWVKRAA